MRIESFEFEPDLLSAFVAFPWDVYANDARWIPPLRTSVARLHSRENRFFSHGEIRNFLALTDDGRPLGRCSAIINRDLVPDGVLRGLVGFFEVVERYDVAAALLDAATGWLNERGIESIWGPMDFSIWHSYRFMTRGFELEPFYGEPYNPRHYPDYFERYGFRPLGRWSSWDLSREQLDQMHASAARMKPKTLEPEGSRVLHFSPESFDEQLRRAHDVLVDGFRKNLGYSPIAYEEFAELNAGLRLLMVPEYGILTETADGEVTGFIYIHPDWGPLMRDLDGEIDLDKIERFLARCKKERVILNTFVIRAPYRKRGHADVLLWLALSEAMRNGAPRAVGALAKEGPTFYDKFGPAPRTYTLYALDR